MTEIEYLYCINEVGNDDFITTSFSQSSDVINIFNFNNEIDITVIKHIAIDYSYDPFVSFNRVYKNSNAIKYYEVCFIDADEDRMIVRLKIIKNCDIFNLREYKRDIKINKIIYA